MRKRIRKPLSEYRQLSTFQDVDKNSHFETQFIDEELLQHAIDFYNGYFGYFFNQIDREEAMSYADIGVRINSDFWKSMMPMNRDRIEFFYRTTPLYFFHDIMRFMDGIHRANFDKWTNERDPVKHIDTLLDFAGGTGGYSIMFAKRGTNVTFVDSNDMQREWVRYIAAVLKLPITVLSSIDDITGEFDGIIAQDVIEHVQNPVDLIKKLMTFTHKDGTSFISMSEMPCCGQEEFAPMHFKVTCPDKDSIGYSYVDNLKTMDCSLPKFRGLMKENYDKAFSGNPSKV